MIPETLAKTAFGKKLPERVNLERSLQAQDRFGGHFVQGHVDDVGVVTKVDKSKGWRTSVQFDPTFHELVIYKGSITINGVSLTIAKAHADNLEVALIPHTTEHTTLGKLQAGDYVNLEFDVLGKYVLNSLKGGRIMQQAKQATTEPFDASDWQLGIVVAGFNRHITDWLYKNALRRAADYGLVAANIDTIKVAGSVELPLALQHLAETGKYQALLAIGCVIRGETPHFDYVCQFATEGILRVQLDCKIPIGFGVLTCENEAQAEARVHLSGDHLDAALHLARALS